MSTLCDPTSLTARAERRDVLLPQEHGSWSLALEPIALGLLAAPSTAGAWLGVAAFAGFLARRPMKLSLREPAGARRTAARRAFALLTIAAVMALAAAIASAGTAWLLWLFPSAAAGLLFAAYDIRQQGRELVPEIAGVLAFTGVAAGIAAAGGFAPPAAAAVGFAMAARSVPTVLFLRARLRGAKAGETQVGLPLGAATAVVFAAAALVSSGALPLSALAGLALLWLRAAVFLSATALRVRARTLGIQELVLGIAYVLAVGAGWPR